MFTYIVISCVSHLEEDEAKKEYILSPTLVPEEKQAEKNTKKKMKKINNENMWR